MLEIRSILHRQCAGNNVVFELNPQQTPPFNLSIAKSRMEIVAVSSID